MNQRKENIAIAFEREEPVESGVSKPVRTIGRVQKVTRHSYINFHEAKLCQIADRRPHSLVKEHFPNLLEIGAAFMVNPIWDP